MRKYLFSVVLLKGICVVDECGEQSEREIDRGLIQPPSLCKCRTAGVGADTGVAVINVDDRLLKRDELVIVSGLCELLGGEMRAVEAERASRGEKI